MRDQHIVLIDIELKGKGVEVTTRSAGELTVRVGVSLRASAWLKPFFALSLVFLNLPSSSTVYNWYHSTYRRCMSSHHVTSKIKKY